MENPRNRARGKKRKGARKTIEVEKKSSSEEHIRSNKRKSGEMDHGEGQSCVKHLKFMRESRDNSEQNESIDPPSTLIFQSFQKINSSFEDANDRDQDDYNIIVNFSTLKGMIDLVAVCPDCSKCTVHLEDMKANRRGFKCKLKSSCRKCDFVDYFQTSKECPCLEKVTSDRHLSEINVCSVMAFCEIGRGLNAMATFSRCMNMPCLTHKAFANVSKSLYDAYESMKNAGHKAKS